LKAGWFDCELLRSRLVKQPHAIRTLSERTNKLKRNVFFIEHFK
jgi:hypothetical protein